VRESASADGKEPAGLAREVKRGERKRRSKRDAVGDEIDRAEDWADEQTSKVEHADDLFKSVVTGQLDPGTIGGDIDALLDWITRLDRAGRFDSEVAMGRRVSRLLALTQRWMDLVRSLHEIKDAADHVKDSNTVAWATHELGTVHLCADNPHEASRLLQEARKMRADLGDRAGLAATEHNMQILCGRVQQLMQQRSLRRPVEYLRSPLVLGLAAVLVGGGVAGGAVVAGHGSANKPAPPSGRHIPALSFTSKGPPPGKVGEHYDFQYSATDPPGITYAVTAGSVPAGLSLSPAGRLSSNPTTPGTYTFTVTATGSDGATTSRQDSVGIAARGAPTISFTSGPPHPGTARQPYTFNYITSGDSGVTYLVTAAGAPPGLSLSADGVLSGIPSTAGSYTFTVSAVGAGGGHANQQDTVRIGPEPGAQIKFTSGSPGTGTVDVPYSFTYAANGASGITYSFLGSLPPGLSPSSDGTLSGTPTIAGNYTFTVSATAPGAMPSQQQSTISIAEATPPPPPPPPPTSSSSAPPAVVLH
jgi:hypothetical protein